MPSRLNSDSSNGLQLISDSSGEIQFQSSGITKATLNSSGLSSPGHVLQVVNATYSTQSTSSSSTYADTGLTATITPSSTSSKILVIVQQSGLAKVTNATGVNLKLLRNSTDLITFENSVGQEYSTAWNIVGGSGTTYLDSPATTSAVTYKTQFASNNNNATVYVQINSASSTITLMEIAG